MSVFNGLPYLEELLNSILGQTFSDLELIVVDDGSTDESWQALRAWASTDPRMIALRNGSNSGYAASQNRALRHARGQYIALQDQDDVSLPRRLELQVEFLDKQGEVGVVGIWPIFIDEGGNALEATSFPHLTDDESLQRRLLELNCFCGPTLMFRRELVDRLGGYDPELRSSEDYDLLLRLAEVTRLANLPHELYLYRQHQESVSKVRRFEQMSNSARALEKAAVRRFAGEPTPGFRRAIVRDFLRAAYIGFFIGELDAARAVLGKALAHYPEIFRRGELVEKVVGRYALQQELFDPEGHIQALFETLLPGTRLMKRTRSRLLSKVHMRAVFEEWRVGPPERVAAHWRAGVRLDPRWALNRGVWMIGLRLFARGHLGALGRGLPSWTFAALRRFARAGRHLVG